MTHRAFCEAIDGKVRLIAMLPGTDLGLASGERTGDTALARRVESLLREHRRAFGKARTANVVAVHALLEDILHILQQRNTTSTKPCVPQIPWSPHAIVLLLVLFSHRPLTAPAKKSSAAAVHRIAIDSHDDSRGNANKNNGNNNHNGVRENELRFVGRHLFQRVLKGLVQAPVVHNFESILSLALRLPAWRPGVAWVLWQGLREFRLRGLVYQAMETCDLISEYAGRLFAPQQKNVKTTTHDATASRRSEGPAPVGVGMTKNRSYAPAQTSNKLHHLQRQLASELKETSLDMPGAADAALNSLTNL